MSLETNIVDFAKAVGADVKAINNKIGQLTALNTTNKNSLVDAINELTSGSGGSSSNVVIDDSAGDGATDKVWSADKVHDEIKSAVDGVKSDLTDGAATALDTLKELGDALNNDPNFAATVATNLANRVRYDEAQQLSDVQKKQARDNIGAVAAADVGNTERGFVSDYETARDS